MYQTTIGKVSGSTATDTTGKMLYIAGAAPVVPGQQVWTDGKIIYGNTYGGGEAPVITPILSGIPYLSRDGILYIYDKYAEKYKEKSIDAGYTVNNTSTFKGFYSGFNVMDATISPEGDLLELGYYEYPDADHPLIIKKNGEEIKTISFSSYKNYNMATVEAMQNETINGILKNPLLEKWDAPEAANYESNVSIYHGLIHPNGSYNIFIVINNSIANENIKMIVGGAYGNGSWDIGYNYNYWIRSASSEYLVISEDGIQQFYYNASSNCRHSKNGYFAAGWQMEGFDNVYSFELPHTTEQNAVEWKLDNYTATMTKDNTTVNGVSFPSWSLLVDCWELPNGKSLIIDRYHDLYKCEGENREQLQNYGYTFRTAYLKNIKIKKVASYD